MADLGDDPLVAALAEACTGDVTPRAELSAYTTLRVGGPARVLVQAEHDDDLAAVGAACRDHGVPWLVVGRGSNLLVADAGWNGVVVTLGRGFKGHRVDGEQVTAGAAEKLPVLAVKVAAEGLTGFEWAAAVPGTLGGGVAMNAGAHGAELAEVLVAADLLRLGTGARERWPIATLGLSYRHSELPSDGIVVAATLRLRAADEATIRAEIEAIKRWRREHQPINEPNCGSVFTNPEGDSAGRLVDAVGAKGWHVGGAHVSRVHANFIVTEPGATASDVRALIGRIRQAVADAHGVWLRPEVVMKGEFEHDGFNEGDFEDGEFDG